ncbi:MAG: methyl-accepting chemotaxis protein, partial [candidate division Zixibacteria bacterium]|nr:methyl-accepting chemotaxis protein [candidate division Zixibacteria bacterium]
MTNGDEHKLEPVAAEFLARGVVREVTVVDAAGRVAYSSETSIAAGEPDNSVWKKLLAERQGIGFDTTINGEQVRVTYRLLRSDGAADGTGDDRILGGLKTVRSRQAVVHASHNSAAFNIIIGCASILVLIVGLVFILSHLIFQPLARVSRNLDEASRGDVDRDIEVRRQDEIGALLTSIRDLINYIRVFAWAAQRIADGDLTMEIEPKSEQDVLGRTFRKMIANLNGVTSRLASNAERLVSAAGQISSTAEQMSHGARHQADQVSQISSAIEQMTATIVESSKNTTHISDVSRQTSQTAEAGGEVVGQTVHGMEQIAQIVTESARSIGQLSQSAEKINTIVATISDIADQTNLLSLNAAIEAARAGDQGRGFAVVADEVRKLADKSSTAAREITDMTREIR